MRVCFVFCVFTFVLPVCFFFFFFFFSLRIHFISLFIFKKYDSSE